MSYDPNSLQAKKGALGEAIVKKYLESNGMPLTKPADTFKSGASIVDFHYTNSIGQELLIEVKTQIARPYGVENAPCYSFPTSRIDAYKNYSNQQGLPVEIWIVDPESGSVYYNDLESLEGKIYIDAREYPFDKVKTTFGGKFHYWHRSQFIQAWQIPEKELVELRKLFELDTSDKQTPPQTDNPKLFVEKLAAFANVGKADFVQAILDLRQAKFDREQAQFKELLAF